MGRHFPPMVQQIKEVQVKKIGILGGMSSASTQIYYQTLCTLTQSELGGLHSPNLLIRSVDFAPLAQHMNDGNWTAIGDVLHAEAKLLAAGGAELIVLATNTMHKLKDQITQGIDLPLFISPGPQPRRFWQVVQSAPHFSQQNSRCKRRFIWIFCATMALIQLCQIPLIRT